VFAVADDIHQGHISRSLKYHEAVARLPVTLRSLSDHVSPSQTHPQMPLFDHEEGQQTLYGLSNYETSRYMYANFE
jgi:hypothetical protein